MNSVERRATNRVSWRGSIQLVTHNGERVDATIVDMSDRGIGVSTVKPLSTGAEVQIDGPGFHGAGVVRYCYPLRTAYRAGIELAPAA